MDSRRPSVVISTEQTGEEFSRLSEPDSAEELPAVTLKVNINTATAEELTLLDGIGPTLAERIVTYRQENGAFQKAEDIMNVSGIGSGTFGKIYDRITVD